MERQEKNALQDQLLCRTLKAFLFYGLVFGDEDCAECQGQDLTGRCADHIGVS